MSRLEIKELLSRIKWRNVLIVLILFAIVAYLIWSLPSSFKVKDNIGLKVSVDPDTIGIGERSKITVEIKNMYPQSEVTVVLNAFTYDDNLVFMESSGKEFNTSDIKIGPSETREVSFTLEARKDALPGNYRVDAKVREKERPVGVEDTVFIKVEKS
ncbi:MAG: hypothetical protein NTU61_01530 [Candidatus Altiarchaeota archaeon]|nr:hypothetical protein [Candidatus Altiarchaeota archaeon]